MSMSTLDEREGSEAINDDAQVGWVRFAGLLVMMIGAFNILNGVIGLFRETYFVVTPDGLLVSSDYKSWGGFWLGLGILQVLTGLGVLGGKQWARIVSALFGLVNAIIGTILRILMLLTLGLFSVIVNALLLSITDSLSSNLTIDEFWWTAIWAAIVLAVVTVILQIVVGSLLGGRQAGGY
jgi:uncharacterized membrane protein YvlD (DUF360 family)